MEPYYLDTPEAIDISYDVAGIGTRFLAAILDCFVFLLLEVLIFIGAVSVAYLGGAAQSAGIILLITLSFLLFWGYFILFETLWSGQTPGKRWQKIRVIRTNGYPIGFTEAVIRNVVRIADFLPMFYGIGILSMFISRQARRLGDYAAGTLVVKERGPVAFKDVQAMVSAGALDAVQGLGEIDPEERAWNLAALQEEDLRVVREFLERAPALDPVIKTRIGNEIATRVADRIGARHPYDPIRFLQRVAYLHQSDGERSGGSPA